MATSNAILTQQINDALADLTADIKNNKLELPSPPDLLIKLRLLANDDKSTANDIAELIKHDPNISGRLIKVANSSLFGSRHHVTTTKAAITRLGSAKVQNLITGLVIAQNFIKNRINGLETYFHDSWQQSNKVAATAYVLAKAKTKLDPEQALLAGIVHNIGVLPLILRLNKVSDFKDNPKLLLRVADIVIPKLYPNAGQLILNNWNFSSTISQTVLTHNKVDFDSPDEINLNDIILLAYNLNKIESMTDEKAIPDELASSSIFLKLWPNKSEAFHELSELNANIAQMVQEMTN